LEMSRKRVLELGQQALAALSGFDDRAAPLRMLVGHIMERRS